MVLGNSCEKAIGPKGVATPQVESHFCKGSRVQNVALGLRDEALASSAGMAVWKAHTDVLWGHTVKTANSQEPARLKEGPSSLGQDLGGCGVGRLTDSTENAAPG